MLLSCCCYFVTCTRRIAAALPVAVLASKWEVHWAVQNNIGGGIQLLLPPQSPQFLANLSVALCARCSDGHHYAVRYTASEATGGRHAWDPILRRLNADDDAFHDLGCARFVYSTLPSVLHSVRASLEFAGSRGARKLAGNRACSGMQVHRTVCVRFFVTDLMLCRLGRADGLADEGGFWSL